MKINNNILDLALAHVKEAELIYTPPCLYFTQEVWDYIEENCEPFMPGVKRIVLPNRFKIGD